MNSKPFPAWMSWVLNAAAVYNLLWGTGVIFFPTTLFFAAGLEPPNYPSITQCLGMVIGVYGIGYGIAARDPLTHWPVVFVGLLGKIFGPVGFVWTASKGELPWSAGLIILTNDLMWWVPFAVIVWKATHDSHPRPAVGE